MGNVNCFYAEIVGATLSLVGSEQRSIVASTNGCQRIGGCNALLMVVVSF